MENSTFKRLDASLTIRRERIWELYELAREQDKDEVADALRDAHEQLLRTQIDLRTEILLTSG